MNTRSISQFVKDGMMGVAIAIVPLALIGIMDGLYPDFISAPIIVLITSFIGTGAGGILLKTATSRERWAMLLMFTAAVSYVTASISTIIAFGIMFDYYELAPGTMDSFSLVGAVIGWLIGFLAGVKFNPVNRFYRVIIGAIASVMTAFGAGVGVFLLTLFLLIG